MQARTERRLGIAAAIVLTAAPFLMPHLIGHGAHGIRIAQAETSQSAPQYR